MKIYLVGGAVRDQVLQLKNSDKDWVVVGGTPEYFLKRGYQAVGKDFPVFLHPETNEEYALARIERKTGPGHQGFECFADPSVTLEEDLSRRDFTINAMAMDQAEKIIDPFNGLADCANKILRHVSPAFVEDPLRCLRLARFAAQLPGFQVAPETEQLCKTMIKAKALTQLSKNRIWQEWQKALIAAEPNRFLAVLHSIGGFDELIQLEFNQLPKDSKLRFALFASHVLDIEQLCQLLAPPKEHQTLAKLICKLKTKPPAKTAEAIYDVLITIDALRRPERLDDCRKVMQVSKHFALWTELDLLPKALAVTNQVSSKQLIADGFSGAELGQKLAQAQIQQIKKMLSEQ